MCFGQWSENPDTFHAGHTKLNRKNHKCVSLVGHLSEGEVDVMICRQEKYDVRLFVIVSYTNMHDRNYEKQSHY